MACGSINAQHSQVLMRADSLIQNENYNAAKVLLTQVINDDPSRFELSNAYFLLSQMYFDENDLEKAAYHNQQSLSIRNDLHYEFIAENYMHFGLIAMRKADNDRALWNFLKASELPYQSIEFGGLLYAYMAQVYYRLEDMENVIKNYRIAMEALQTAFEEANELDLNHYRIRRHRLYYDNFLVGYL